MRVFASILTVTALIAACVSAEAHACPSGALLSTRGGGFFDKLDAKISSVTKSSSEVRPGWVGWGGCCNQVVRSPRSKP